MARHVLIKLFLCFAVGSFCALAMAPYNMWPVFILGFGVLYAAVVQADKGWKAFLCGYCFAFGYFVFGLYWIGNALLVEGNPYKWAWPLAVCGLPALLACFNGFACLLAKRFLDLKRWHGYLGFASLLALFEYARGHVFTGFPWNLYGYAWVDTPLLQIASLESVYLLTWLTILWLGFGGFVFMGKGRQGKIALGFVLFFSLAAAYAYGHFRAAIPVFYHDTVQIKIIQPNTQQHEKWQQNKMRGHFETALALSTRQADEPTASTIIIWPETAISSRFLNDPAARSQMAKMLRGYPQESILLTGALRYQPVTKTYHNSLIAIDAGGHIGDIHDKGHLVPFGEYIPFQDHIPLAPVTQFTGFEAGPGLRGYETLAGLVYSPLICYEVIFPGASIPSSDEKQPDFIVNVTNDAWYGLSPGPHQHFTKARFRAVETGIPVIRAANTGISGLIDPLGHVAQKSQLFETQAVLTKLPEKFEVQAKNKYFKYVLFPGFAALCLFLGVFIRIVHAIDD